MCHFTIESVALSELILSISANLMKGLIRFGLWSKQMTLKESSILKMKLSGNRSRMGHFPLSADLVNGEGGQYWTLPDSRSLAKWLLSFNKPTKTITNTEAKKDKQNGPSPFPHVLKRSRKKRIFYGQADHKRSPLPFSQLFVIFFDILLTLYYVFLKWILHQKRHFHPI